MPANDIDRLFIRLEPARMQLATVLQETILSADPGVTGSLKWGRPNYSYNGRDLAFLCIKEGVSYVEIGFFNSGILRDPQQLLAGKGNAPKRMRLYQADEATLRQVEHWINRLLEDVKRSAKL